MPDEEVRRIVARIPESLFRQAKVKSAMTGRTLTDVIREALAQWVTDDDNDEEKEKRGGR